MGEELQGSDERVVVKVIDEASMGDDLDAQEDEKAIAHILGQTEAIYDTMLLRCAIELDLFDVIHRLSHPTVPEIAAALSPHPINTNHLARVLRYLAHMRLLSFGEATYSLTRASQRFLLRQKSSSTSLRSAVLMSTDECFLSTWYGLGTALLTGGTLFGVKHGAGLFDAMAQRPELGALFNEAMAEDTRLLMPAVLRAVSDVLGGARSMVDVGGGTGAAAALVAEAHPGLRCTVLDLPEVIVRASAAAAAAVEFVEGDMFESVPSADVVMLKRILHDWEDDDCVKILKRCKEAIPSKGGKVIIVEVVMDDNEDNLFNKHNLRQDLGMMFIGGKERSRDEWNSLLCDAGFIVHKVTTAMLGQSVIEAHPR